MRWFLALCAFAWAATAWSQGPATAPMPKKAPLVKKAVEEAPVTYEELYKAAVADLSTVPPDIRPYIRYFDARSFPKEARKDAKAVFDYQVNAISRESRIVRSREVTAWLWAVRTDDYKWDTAVYEDLVRVNYYHTIPVELKTAVVEEAVERKPVTKVRQVLVSNGRGGYSYRNEEYVDYEETRVTKTVAAKDSKKGYAPAPWVPALEAGMLVQALQTQVPMFRADQFVHQVGVQKDRDGHGYYDFLGFKKLADVEKFARLDRKAAIELYRELGAIVSVSGVTLNNRQLFRLQALTGPWWESRDTTNNVGRKEATGNLLEDFDADAFEIVFTLYNRMPGYYLADKKGVQQETAPDFIAGDQRSTNNDRRIHAGMSCIVCHHDGGLRTMRDWARQIYNPETGIALGTLALDKDRARRVESVYLGPLFKSYRKDADDFAEAIFEASGLRPQEMSKAYETFWSRYLDEPVTLEKAAREIGVNPKDMQETLIAYAKKKRITDTVLASYLVPDPLPVRREHFEERFGLLLLILGGVNP